MAKLIETLDSECINNGEMEEAFKKNEIYFQYNAYGLEDADKQAIKNTVSLVLNRIRTFGLCESYVNSYGILWQMWIGRPTDEEITQHPFKAAKDPLYEFMDVLFNPNKHIKKDGDIEANNQNGSKGA